MFASDIFSPPLPNQQRPHLYWEQLHGASIGLALQQANANSSRPMLIIVPDNLTVARLLDELHFFATHEERILHFPDWETLPYDHFSPHQDIISERISTLCKLTQLAKGIVITTITTLMQRLPPAHYLTQHSFDIKAGDHIHLDIFRTRLTNSNYHAVSQVREHGEFAIRGSIIDIYPMGSKQPYRIDLLDDEVDSIRIFSPETQRTLEKISQINLLPAKEFPLNPENIDYFRQAWRSQFSGNPMNCPIYQDISEGICSAGIEYYFPLFFPQTATLFDYLPTSTILIKIGDLHKKSLEFWQEINTRYQQMKDDISRPLLPPQQLFLTVESLNHAIRQYDDVQINTAHPSGNYFNAHSLPPLDINHKATKPLLALEQYLAKENGRILFCAETAGRREILLQLFRNISLQPKLMTSWQEFINTDEQIAMVVAPIEESFCLTKPRISVITEMHLFGKRIMQRRLRRKTTVDPDALIHNLTELQINDPVVHLDHGIGRYLGLQTLNVGEQINEFLCLEYQAGDKLYVPVSSLHLISRYTGSDPALVAINKLGTETWQRAKRRAAEKVRDVAAELLDIYAKRASRPGEACQLPQEQYAAFTAGFPFEETPDQLQAIEQVMRDMCADKPMDRVICGDVGFGKTEVAIRAAFLAVANGKQVALLVPTTLLAQQHYQHFQDRFADWPIKVEMLSRFRTSKEQEKIIAQLAAGQLDIVVGTHKLLQQDMKFKSLGLVIIDEEHRFGVKQKEALKALRTNVDILTLTATPIPRTMNMALSGIRDLSVITTPPARRLSVKTFVHEYNNQLIQEAIRRELLRGGQVYFLHNEVDSIHHKADEINKLVNEARTSIAHGQMHERELERVMSEFYHRHTNVLICSTIIESGIDIPTANTIIINRADKFGIAQLHQLRGRVGRSHHQAYAYLLTPPRDHITPDAEKRLQAIAEFDQLGIGFTLATHDLEIRGAGELLGEEQSGNMHEIGFTLYMDLLSRAVESLKSGKEPDFEKSLFEHRTEIDLRVTALIPEDYLADIQLRLIFYKRIANANSVAALDEIQVEMIDRFGLLPDSLKRLFAITELKLAANVIGIVKIEANEKGGKIEFNAKPNIKPETIIRLIQAPGARYRLDGPTRLRFQLPSHEIKNRVQLVTELVDLLRSG